MMKEFRDELGAVVSAVEQRRREQEALMRAATEAAKQRRNDFIQFRSEVIRPLLEVAKSVLGERHYQVMLEDEDRGEPHIFLEVPACGATLIFSVGASPIRMLRRGQPMAGHHAFMLTAHEQLTEVIVRKAIGTFVENLLDPK
ncbi:MAG: hypothetical protein ACHQ4J_05560 [Candidatus Binatia bacterium]